MIWREDELEKLIQLAKTKNTYEISSEIGRSYDSVRKKLRELRGYALNKPKKPVGKLVEEDKGLHRLQSEGKVTQKKYKLLLAEYEELENKLAALVHLNRTPQEVNFSILKGTDSAATAVIVASDWHVEERVRSADVSGLNEFNLRIADERVRMFFSNVAKLIKISQKDTKVSNAVLALLGDFISGSIHDELVENNQLLPAEAIWKAQNYLYEGILFLLKETDVRLTVVCHSGNHGRMTDKTHFATEMGNSLEAYMYYNLAHLFKGEKRVQFIVAEGYHSYVTVGNFVVRIHHGHAIRYAGGVGGIYIPVNKAIAQWNKGRKADLDVFGHFHQFRDGGNFICNGSLIGYNAFALSIKADFEKPRQAFFLIDHRRGKSVVAPIWVE